MAELKTTQEDREAIRWAHVATGSEFAPTMRALDDLDTLLAERESLRSTMGGLIACNDTLLAENAALSAELERLREILAPRGLIELEPTVEESAVRVVSERDEAEARGAKLDVVAEAARDACSIYLNDAGPQAFATIAKLREALAALEAP